MREEEEKGKEITRRMPKRATAIVLNENEQEDVTRRTKRHRREHHVVVRALGQVARQRTREG
jgi:hypothetical protein